MRWRYRAAFYNVRRTPTSRSAFLLIHEPTPPSSSEDDENYHISIVPQAQAQLPITRTRL